MMGVLSNEAGMLVGGVIRERDIKGLRTAFQISMPDAF